MLVLLPDAEDGLSDLEAKVTAPLLRNCLAKMGAQEVILELPRFKITWGSTDLADSLRALGMSLPFEPFQADFSGINGHAPPHAKSLNIESVYHKGFRRIGRGRDRSRRRDGGRSDCSKAPATVVHRRPPVPVHHP